MQNKPIYLDHNSTTPVDPIVLEKMLPYFTDAPGNASSHNHAYGWEAKAAVEKAEEQLADLLDVDPENLIFTSGATESLNLAIKGLATRWQGMKNHIISCETEHPAVLDTLDFLELQGWNISRMKVDEKGNINLRDLEAMITDQTLCIVLMWANNETGLVHPMEIIGEMCREYKVFFCCDATQAVGKIPVFPRTKNINLMAFSGHKSYGTKGIGGLYISDQKPKPSLKAQIHGGGHQNNLRSGTLNIPGIVGMGAAAELADHTMIDEMQRVSRLRDQLEHHFLENVEEVKINGDSDHRLPHVSNLCFKLVDGEQLMGQVNDRVSVSSGSACTSADPDPSHVLLAMGLSETDAKSSIRFSLGRSTTEEQIKKVCEIFDEKIALLRRQNPVWEMYRSGVDLGI